MQLDISNPIIILALGINVITFILFWFDKWMAGVRGWRIPEMVLWLCSLIGGSIGAWIAMILFHHKTKKLSFQLVMVLILLVQLGGILMIISGIIPNVFAYVI